MGITWPTGTIAIEKGDRGDAGHPVIASVAKRKLAPQHGPASKCLLGAP